MKIQHLILGAIAAIGLLLSPGCAGATSTANTGLYAFDATNLRILAWDDMDTLYDEGSTGSLTSLPSPSRTLTSSSYLGEFSSLGWGGICMDRSRNRLWLVSDTGLVARIDSIRSRADGSDLGSSYIRTFQLGTDSDDRLSDGTFGQIAVDVSSGALCVAEWSSSDSRVWVISSPTSYAQDDTVAASSVTLVNTSNDKYGYGVAVGSSNRLYAYFNSGSTITDASGDTYTGPRLRLGTTSSSSFSSVIVGTSSTELASDGILGADTSNSILYVSRRSTSSPVIAFKHSQFKSTSSSNFDVAPSASLPSNSTTPLYIRAIAHPGNKDWLVGVGGTSTGGATYLSLWKKPSSDTSTEPVIFSGSATIRGIALDGAASSD